MDVSSKSWITQALGIASDLPKNYSRDLSNEKISLTKAPRHKEGGQHSRLPLRGLFDLRKRHAFGLRPKAALRSGSSTVSVYDTSWMGGSPKTPYRVAFLCIGEGQFVLHASAGNQSGTWRDQCQIDKRSGDTAARMAGDKRKPNSTTIPVSLFLHSSYGFSFQRGTHFA